MPEERNVHVIADQRERGKITKTLEQIPGVSVETQSLDCGDYVLGSGVVVERKSATDFILSVVDGSLVDKANKLKAGYERPVYIVESGERDLFVPRFHQKAFDVHMALAYLSVLHRIPVLTSPDVEHTAMLIYFMAVDAQYHLGANLGRRSNKPEFVAEAQAYFLEGLPGIDGDRAEALLRHFGGVGNLLRAPARDIAAAANLDPDSASLLEDVLTRRWP